MKVLVACEESQRICIAFRERGHEAYSCDLIECSGGHPEWHIQQNCLDVINDNDWDLIIAHPPCTHLSICGARSFPEKRADGRQREAIEFFGTLLNLDVPKLCVENPICIISGNYVKEHFPDLCEKYGLPRKPSQRIQPYQFGHPYTKTTCLWLKGLPNLVPTDILTKPEGGWVNQAITADGRYGGYNGKFHDAKTKSKTFEGIARAMAEQWG